jgi:hypothetical protein
MKKSTIPYKVREKVYDSSYSNSGKERQTGRLYEQKHHCIVHRNGVEIDLYGNKRPYPKDKKCEFCNTIPKHSSRIDPLDYHHWDDTDISKGLWSCQKCHRKMEAAEFYENNKKFVIRYRVLKKLVERKVI